MVHKTVLNVDVSCDKCKQEVFNIVTKLEGVNKMEADPEKSTLTIIGDADPYAIIACLRKAGKKALFVSVGPPPKPEPKPDPKKCPCPGRCGACNPELAKCPGNWTCKPDSDKCQCPSPCLGSCSSPCLGTCPTDYHKCLVPNPAPKPETPKCQCSGRGMGMGSGPCWVCQPIAMMSYQEPAPPICSIM